MGTSLRKQEKKNNNNNQQENRDENILKSAIKMGRVKGSGEYS